MVRVEVNHSVAADPAGVALLLAELAGDPRVNRSPAITDINRVDAGFSAAIKLIDTSGRVAAGEIAVADTSGAGCKVRIGVDAPFGWPGRDVEHDASAFLDVLADRARSRSCAA